MAECVIVASIEALPSGDFLLEAAGMRTSEFPDRTHAIVRGGSAANWNRALSSLDDLIAEVRRLLVARGDEVIAVQGR